MSEVVDVIMASNMMRAGGSASEEKIGAAEETLGLKFATDYKEYLRSFGFISYEGHELTGISESQRLNVVSVTQEAREIYININPELYVIEDTGYEGILILQNQKGEVFQIEPHSDPQKVCDSLADYIAR